MISFQRQFRHLLQYLGLAPSRGHKPGFTDVSTSQLGVPFKARPNFYYFEGCGRPCYLPLNPGPKLGDGTGTWPVTLGWPCEGYFQHDQHAGPHCYSNTPHDGDWVEVVGQVTGPIVTNERHEQSEVWDVIRIPLVRATRNQHLLGEADSDGCVLVYAPDMWLGNTGLHFIPFSPRS